MNRKFPKPTTKFIGDADKSSRRYQGVYDVPNNTPPLPSAVIIPRADAPTMPCDAGAIETKTTSHGLQLLPTEILPPLGSMKEDDGGGGNGLPAQVRLHRACSYPIPVAHQSYSRDRRALKARQYATRAWHYRHTRLPSVGHNGSSAGGRSPRILRL